MPFPLNNFCSLKSEAWMKWANIGRQHFLMFFVELKNVVYFD